MYNNTRYTYIDIMYLYIIIRELKLITVDIIDDFFFKWNKLRLLTIDF